MALACPVCGFDPGSLTPTDATVALRSLPRRFSALVAPAADGPDDDAEPVGGEGGAEERRAVVLAEAGRAADAIASIGRDLHKTLVEDSPVLETTGDIATAGTGGEAATALDRLAAAVAAVADEAEAQPGEAWTRRGERPDGPVTAGDLLRAAVHAGVHHLRLAQQV